MDKRENEGGNGLAILLTIAVLALLVILGFIGYAMTETMGISGSDAFDLIFGCLVSVLISFGITCSIVDALDDKNPKDKNGDKKTTRDIETKWRKNLAAIIATVSCILPIFAVMTNSGYTNSTIWVLAAILSSVVYLVVRYTKKVVITACVLIAVLAAIYLICSLIGGFFTWYFGIFGVVGGMIILLLLFRRR